MNGRFISEDMHGGALIYFACVPDCVSCVYIVAFFKIHSKEIKEKTNREICVSLQRCAKMDEYQITKMLKYINNYR